MTKLSCGVHAWFIWASFHASWQSTNTPAKSQLTHIVPLRIRIILRLTLALGLIALGLTACVSESQEHARLTAQAKVSRVDAERIALTQAPNGTEKEAELEKEKGKLIWSFDLATPGTKDITEVAVDAITGAIMSVEKETPKRQAKEKDEDAKAKK